MKLNKKQILLSVLCLILVAAITFTVTFFATRAAYKSPFEEIDPETVDLEKLNYFLKVYTEFSLYGLPEDVDLTEYLLYAIVGLSADRYDAYFSPVEYEDYTNTMAGTVYGIGVLVEQPAEDACEYILILDAFEDSGAGRAGLESGDRIVAINGVPVSEVGYEASVASIAGQMGTTVEITYLRGSDPTPKTCSPVRGACTRDTVYSYIDGDVGYIRITTFESVTTAQFIAAVSAMEEAGVSGIVFDVRGNGGGLLRTVSEMLAYLLPDGTIGSVDYKSERYTDYTIYSQGDTLYMKEAYTTDTFGGDIQVAHQLSVPVVILTDENTASAAELFTAALKETSEAGNFVPVTLVGGTTYGKGTMQTTFPLKDGSYMKMTVAKYNPPSGNNYDGEGIDPDHKAETTVTSNQLYLIDPEEDAVRQMAIQLLRGAQN